MQLEFAFMGETPYPGAPLLTLRGFALMVKANATQSLFSEDTQWLEQWKSLCIYEAIPGILILERLDKQEWNPQEWNPMAVIRYARSFFPKGQIHRIAPITASGVKWRRNVVMLTDNFERNRCNYVSLEMWPI